MLHKHGIDCAGKTARRMSRADYDAYDLLIGMDYANLRNMERICGGDPEGKIRLLLDFAGRHEEVADPWYTGDFQAAWDDIAEGCTALLDALTA
jgi:protein-tyrosine phosphatase